MTLPPDRVPRRVLVPHAPLLVAGFREVLWLHPDGEIEALAPADARSRVERETPMLCHGPDTARRLDMPGFPALDLLELFAFAYPAQFCVPTPRGVAEVLGLPPPRSSPEACVTLATVARALLEKLAEEVDPQVRAIAEVMDKGGWLWGPAVLAALPAAESGALRKAAGLRVWIGLDEWSEPAPSPPPGNQPVGPEEARSRLAELLGAAAERRPEQSDYAAAVTPAFAPRDQPDQPRAALAEAGTGVGKTLGYIAAASLWAEKNRGSVWISTYTRNLQTQIAGELDRLYPDPGLKTRNVVIRKGRENFICLLNYEDALGAAMGRPGRPAGHLGLIARWITARQARIVVANHALVMAQAALGGIDDATVPTRYVFDEGHHLLDAADSAFSVRLSGQEGRELRRWIVGAEAGGRSRARGLRRRIGDLVEGDDNGAKALLDVLAAARVLPGNGWAQRVAEARGHQGFERFLVQVRQQVLARAVLADSGYGLQAEARPPIEGLVEAAVSLAESLERLAAAMLNVSEALRARLEDPDDPPEPSLRQRLDATIRSLDRRAGLQLAAWSRLL